MSPSSPILQALIVADHVYIDGSTKKKVIAGTFNQMQVQRCGPDVVIQGVFAYISLTEVSGELNLEVRYVNLRDAEVLLSMHAPLQLPRYDPLSSVELVIQIPPLPVPHSGVYALELLSEDTPLGSLRISVSELSSDDQGGTA